MREILDPRCFDDLVARVEGSKVEGSNVDPTCQIVLVGHRAAGKTRLLPIVAGLLGRPGVDLDDEIARRHARPLRSWVQEDPASFRRAERETFAALPPGLVIAAGGGFLALHAELLAGHRAVLVPISFETYRDRLTADTTRPRLRPELPLEEELREVYSQREAAHARTGAVHLGDFLGEVLAR